MVEEDDTPAWGAREQRTVEAMCPDSPGREPDAQGLKVGSDRARRQLHVVLAADLTELAGWPRGGNGGAAGADGRSTQERTVLAVALRTRNVCRVACAPRRPALVQLPLGIPEPTGFGRGDAAQNGSSTNEGRGHLTWQPVI